MIMMTNDYDWWLSLRSASTVVHEFFGICYIVDSLIFRSTYFEVLWFNDVIISSVTAWILSPLAILLGQIRKFL